MRSVCVFCGSQVGNKPEYRRVARELGHQLADEGISLVFGGGHIGLMGVVADAVLERGVEVIGVIPRALMERELAHTGLTELHVVETMHERKALMASRSEAFVAIPGGYGTADELFEILTWRQLGIHDRPIGLVNSLGYFDSLLGWIDRMVQEGFLKEKNRDLLEVANTPSELLSKLRRSNENDGQQKG